MHDSKMRLKIKAFGQGRGENIGETKGTMSSDAVHNGIMFRNSRFLPSLSPKFSRHHVGQIKMSPVFPGSYITQINIVHNRTLTKSHVPRVLCSWALCFQV